MMLVSAALARMPQVTQMSVNRSLLLGSIPLLFLAPGLFYFRAYPATLAFLLFALFVAVPLAVSIYWIARTKSIDLVNRHYLKVLVFYFAGSAFQLYFLGTRALQFMEFKAGEDSSLDGSEFKIPILAGLLAWAKFVLIMTRAKNAKINYVAYAMIVLFEAVANLKRSALVFLCIPIILRLLLDRKSNTHFYFLTAGLVVVFALVGNFREVGRDVFYKLEPLSDNSVLNWLLTYTSLNYHVAYQKFLEAASFDSCFLLKLITSASGCGSDFSLFGFNATTHVGNFVETGIPGMLLLQLIMIYFALCLNSLSPVSRGLYVYILTLYLLNLFGAYILERNEFLLAVGWFSFEFIKKQIRRLASRRKATAAAGKNGYPTTHEARA